MDLIIPLQIGGSNLTLAVTIAITVIFIAVIIWLIPFRLWLATQICGSPVSIIQLVSMRFLRIPPIKIVDPYIAIRQVDPRFNINALETHHMAGGDTLQAAKGYIKALKENLPVDFVQLAALDLMGYDPLATVEEWLREGVRTEEEIRASMEAAAEAKEQQGHSISAQAR